jgi:hypothetical protein
MLSSVGSRFSDGDIIGSSAIISVTRGVGTLVGPAGVRLAVDLGAASDLADAVAVGGAPPSRGQTTISATRAAGSVAR